MSLPIKAIFVLVAPIYAIYLWFVGTRQKIAEHLALDDLQSRDEILDAGGEFEQFDDLVVAT